MAEQLDLPERPLGVDLVVEGVGDLLDGHLLPGLRVERGADDAVGALADGEDGGLVLDGDLEDVAEDVVLDEPAPMAERRLDVLHRPRRTRTRPRHRRPGVRHLRVRRLSPAVHPRFGSRGHGFGRAEAGHTNTHSKGKACGGRGS